MIFYTHWETGKQVKKHRMSCYASHTCHVFEVTLSSTNTYNVSTVQACYISGTPASKHPQRKSSHQTVFILFGFLRHTQYMFSTYMAYFNIQIIKQYNNLVWNPQEKHKVPLSGDSVQRHSERTSLDCSTVQLPTKARLMDWLQKSLL